MTDPEPFPGPDAAFHEYLADGRFMIQRCADCERHVFAPRVLCKYCGSTRLGWVEASGQATVYSATVMRRRPEKGGDYLYALMELEEGPRMISTVIDTSPGDVCIGDTVTAEIETGATGSRVVFRRDGGRT